MIGRLITLTNLNRLLQKLQSHQLARPERIEPYIKPSFQAVKRGLNTPFGPSFGPRLLQLYSI